MTAAQLRLLSVRASADRTRPPGPPASGSGDRSLRQAKRCWGAPSRAGLWPSSGRPRTDGGVLGGGPLEPAFGGEAGDGATGGRCSDHRTGSTRAPGAMPSAWQLFAVTWRVQTELCGDQAAVERVLPRVVDVEPLSRSRQATSVRMPAAVHRAEFPVDARVVAERRPRPEVQLRQTAVEEADRVGEVATRRRQGRRPPGPASRGCGRLVPRQWSCGVASGSGAASCEVDDLLADRPA